MLRSPSSRFLAAVPIASAACVTAGCGGNGQSALTPRGKDATDIASLWWVMLVAAALIFAVVLTLLLVAVLRRRGGGSTRGWAGVWLPVAGGIVVPTIVLAALFALTVGTLSSTSPAEAGAAALTIRVTGRQWFWDVTYPSAHARTANEIHIPVGEPVQVDVSSGDVIHSFWVPELDRKVDMIPGRTNTVTLEATHPGTYRGQCAEFCGLQHANMAFVVVAEEPERFHAWLQEQSMPARPPPTPALKSGQEVVLLGVGAAAGTRRLPALPAGVAAALILVAWHAPPAFDAALRLPVLHAAEHASFLVAGILLWAPLLSRSTGPLEALAFLFATRLVQTVLGNVLLWLPRPLYAGSGTLHDQRLAAAIMLGEGILATLAAGAWLFARLLREERSGQRGRSARPAGGRQALVAPLGSARHGGRSWK